MVEWWNGGMVEWWSHEEEVAFALGAPSTSSAVFRLEMRCLRLDEEGKDSYLAWLPTSIYFPHPGRRPPEGRLGRNAVSFR